MYGLLYIRFELFMFLYVIIMTALALPILIPLNIVAAGNAGSGFAETTATNIPEGSTFLIAHTVLTIIFVLIGLTIVIYYQRMYFHTRKVFRNRDFVNSHTLKINDVPKSVQHAEMHAFMDSLYPGEVKSVQIPPDAPKLISLKNKKQNHLKKLKQAEYRFQESGDRPTVSPGGLTGSIATFFGLRAKEDAMAFHKAAIVDTSAQIQRRQKFEHKSSGVAFITFATAIRTHHVARDFYLRSDRKALLKNCPDQELRKRLKPEQWNVNLAERPQDIYWNHLSTSKYSKFIRRVIVFAIVLIVALVWSIPISFLASVDTLEQIPGLGLVVEEVISLNPFFQDIIEGYIPSLLTTLFVLCLPFILNNTVPFEKPDTVATHNASVLRLYYTFIILNVLVFPTLLIGTLDSLSILFEDGVTSVLAQINFTLQGAFFINYVIQQTFFSGMIRLVRPQHIFQLYWFMGFAVTEEEKEDVKRRSAHEMEYRIRFAQMLVVIACLLTFAVVVPLILPAGIIYLIIIHIIDKNNILHVFPKVLAGDSSMIISVINMFCIALLIYEVMTAIFFYFKDSIYAFSILIVLIALTLLVTALLNFFNWYNKYRYIKYGQPLLIEWNLPSDLLEKAYIHPGMVDEEGDINSTIDNFISGNGNIDSLLKTDIELANENYLKQEQGVMAENGMYEVDDDWGEPDGEDDDSYEEEGSP